MAETASYLTLKLAQNFFQKSPDALGPEELKKVNSVAAKQRALEALILSTAEAASVNLPESSIGSSLMEIRARYEKEEDYLADLERVGLDPDRLRREIERDLTVEAVLDRIGSRAATVNDTDVEIFYFMHKARFIKPETRVLRHILITINDSLEGNDRSSALACAEAIHARLVKSPDRFEEQALKHSECPTAMHGGLLGTVPRGELYAELEPTAFALAEGQLSAPVESPLGFHILRCDTINVEHTLPLNETRERIRTHLMDQRRKTCQKSWINSLQRKG